MPAISPHAARAAPATAFVFDREAMLASLDRLEALENGAKLFFGHDADTWQGVPQAPLPAPGPFHPGITSMHASGL